MRQRQAQTVHRISLFVFSRCTDIRANDYRHPPDYRHAGCRYVIEAEMPKVCISKLSVALDDWQEELDSGFTTQLAYRPLTAGSKCCCVSTTCIASQCSRPRHCSHRTTTLPNHTDSLSFTAAVRVLCRCWQLSEL